MAGNRWYCIYRCFGCWIELGTAINTERNKKRQCPECLDYWYPAEQVNQFKYLKISLSRSLCLDSKLIGLCKLFSAILQRHFLDGERIPEEWLTAAASFKNVEINNKTMHLLNTHFQKNGGIGFQFAAKTKRIFICAKRKVVFSE